MMNGGSRQMGPPGSIETSRPGSSLEPSHTPKGQSLVNAYRRDAFSSMPSPRADGPILLDLKDPLQVHLMTETALFDSREYQILSEEEVDYLKKTINTTNQRIDQTRSDLAVQTKYRDAAVSMTKLYTGAHARDSVSSEEAEEAMAERRAVQKRCEELASDLFLLEKRAMDGRRRLLEHTAGILQLTHTKSKKPGAKTPLVNGVPASPESMHTASHGRNSVDYAPDDFFLFNEGSLYQSFDQLDALVTGKPIEPPIRSPIREQQKQLTVESEKLRGENEDLRSQMETLIHELGSLRDDSADQFQLVVSTEKRLEAFNNQLREMLDKADPEKGASLGIPPANKGKRGSMIDNHLEYLEDGLSALTATHANPVARQQIGDSDAVLTGLWDKIQSGLADSREKKQQMRKERQDRGLEVDEDDMSDGESFDPNEQYSMHAFSSKVQWLSSQAIRLQDQKAVLKRQIKQQRELNNKSDHEKDEAIRQKAEEVEAVKSEQLKVEKELASVRHELSQTMEDIDHMQKSRGEESEAIDEALKKLKERNARIASLEASSKEIANRLAETEAEMMNVSAALEEAEEARDIAEEAREVAEKKVEEHDKAMAAKEVELENMTGMYAELKMEATLAQAELDGAYGSRKERAAEIAALHDTSEIAKVRQRTANLESELRSTAKDLADVTAQGLESERKIGDLEAQLDKAKAEKDKVIEELEAELESERKRIEERLESEVARLAKDKQELQEQLDQERFKATGPLSPGGGRGATHLTESYRNGLRAERKKYDELLKNEQMLRRKIEDELRALKKAQGPGKSPLSPRPTS